jgi:catechol 2,3-dioxygenase-like lactoylglutathione lyase family enzyme
MVLLGLSSNQIVTDYPAVGSSRDHRQGRSAPWRRDATTSMMWVKRQPRGGTDVTIDLAAINAERERIKEDFLAENRPESSARGLHHFALICSDVRRTIEFYQGVLEFPLTEIFENRDYQGSNHFFFDIGQGNLLAFFDLPGLDLGPYAEVLGGLHHLAISVTQEKWDHLRGKLDAAGVEYLVESEKSIYFRDPDGARLELLADPLGEMYGTKVL